MNWLTTNLVPAWNDPAWSVTEGSAVIASDKITLPPASVVRLVLSSNEIMTKASGIRLVVKFTGTFSDIENYDPKSLIGMRIAYLDGSSQSVKIMFSRNETLDEYYLDTTDIETDSKTISSCTFYFKNMDSALGTLYMYNTEVYKSEDVNSSQVENIVTTQVKISSVPTYNDGIIVNLVNGKSIYMKEIYNTEETEIIGLLINEKDYIQMPRTAGDLPAMPT